MYEPDVSKRGQTERLKMRWKHTVKPKTIINDHRPDKSSILYTVISQLKPEYSFNSRKSEETDKVKAKLVAVEMLHGGS